MLSCIDLAVPIFYLNESAAPDRRAARRSAGVAAATPARLSGESMTLRAHLRKAVLASESLAAIEREASRMLAAVTGEAARTANETRRQETEIRAEIGA